MQIEYVAGLVDGEGSIMLLGQGPRRCRTPEVAIAIQEREVLEAVRFEHGGFITGHGSVPQWHLKGSKALALLRALRPHFKIERRAALADLLIEDPLICRMDLKNDGRKIPHSQRVFDQMRARNSQRLATPAILPAQDPSPGDLAYMAGILDGEGHVSFKTRRIEVFSTDPELPAWIASRFGGAVSLGKRASGNSRQTWRWTRNATGCMWAAGVADLMLLDRKSHELRPMQDFKRTPPPAPATQPHAADEDYLRARRAGVLRTAAVRETQMPPQRARLLDLANGF